MKATGGNGTISAYCLKMVKYESVQLYSNFRLTFDEYTKTMKRFPLDTHLVNFAITFTPVFMYCSENKNYYELKVGDNKGKTLKIKGYYYPKVKALQHFPLHSYVSVDERILDFDIIPESLSISKCDYGIRNSGVYSNRKTALTISFSLYRLITAPFINLFLPIYVIAFLVPFALFFRQDIESATRIVDCNFAKVINETNTYKVTGCAPQPDDRVADFDLTATYLSTLLLTLVAHRHVISQSQVAAIAFTTCDRDFLFSLILIVVQMIGFVLSEITKKDSPLEAKNQHVFYIEEALILVIWILPRCYILLSSGDRVSRRTKPMLWSEYLELRSGRDLFGLQTTKVKQKTFFSSSIKLIAGYCSQQTKKAEVVAIPIDDLYRIRLYDDEQAREVLLEINMNPFFQEEYTEGLTEENVKGIKIVYSYAKSKKLFLEVEILWIKKEDYKIDKKTKLRRYTKSKLEKLNEHLSELSCLTKGQARWLYYLSCGAEIYGMFAGNGTPLGLYSWKEIFKDWSICGVCKRLFYSMYILLCKEWGPCGIGRRISETWTRMQEDRKLLDAVLFLLKSQPVPKLCAETKEKIEGFFPPKKKQ